MSFPAMPPLGPPNLANGDSGPGGQNDYAPWVRMRPYLRNLLVAAYDARFYGATGDGVTNDQAAIQLALDLCRLNGGGVVYLPAGRYRLVPVATGGSTGAALGCLFIGANTIVRGDGPDATILLLDANSPNQSYVLHNYTIAGGDTDIVLEHLTVDGNAANQAGTVDAQYGCRFVRARRVTVFDCTFHDLRGTTAGGNGPNGTAGESFAQQFDLCLDVAVIESVAYATSANTSSGFASNQSTNVHRVSCTAFGLGISSGFTDFQSQGVFHDSCRSYLNALDGFHLEGCAVGAYVNCYSGGVMGSGAFFYTAGQSLGNGRHGYGISGAHEIDLVNCNGSNNGAHGLMAFNAGVVNIRVIGGNYNANAQYGIALDNNSRFGGLRLIAAPNLIGNTTAPLLSSASPGNITSVTGQTNTPAVPATTVAFSSPFPFACWVYISGGTITAINVSGTALPAFLNAGGSVLVPAGGTITLTYTGTPGWTWWSTLT